MTRAGAAGRVRVGPVAATAREALLAPVRDAAVRSRPGSGGLDLRREGQGHPNEEAAMAEKINVQDLTEEEHIHEASPEELAEEERLGSLQSEAPDQADRTQPGVGPNTAADVGSGGGGTTADPGRQDPLTPGKGRL